jgi:hypothetical protein
MGSTDPRSDETKPSAPTSDIERALAVTPRKGCLGRIVAAGTVVLGGLYLLNPSFGLFELIPDTTPLIGNLDEAAATALLIFGLRYLGAGLFSRGR